MEPLSFALGILREQAERLRVPAACIDRLATRWTGAPDEARVEITALGAWLTVIGEMRVRGERARADYFRGALREMLVTGQILPPPTAGQARPLRRAGLLRRSLIGWARRWGRWRAQRTLRGSRG